MRDLVQIRARRIALKGFLIVVGPSDGAPTASVVALGPEALSCFSGLASTFGCSRLDAACPMAGAEPRRQPASGDDGERLF